MRRIRFIGAYTVSILVCAATASAAPMYHLTDLGGSFSTAYGINNHGQIVGDFRVTDDSTHVFLYSDGTMQDLNALVTSSEGWEAWEARGINDSGQITGTVDPLGPAGIPNHAFMYSGGTLTVLGLDGTDSQSLGRCINNRGQVSGYVNDGHGAFLYDGTMHNLGAGAGLYGYGINDSGQIVGSGFLWTPTTPNSASGAIHYLSILLGGSTGTAYGINNSGQIAGYSLTTGVAHAFLWTPTTPNGDSGTALDLGTLGGTVSVANAINDSGQVVGFSRKPRGGGDHAFLYSAGTMNDLNTLADSSGAGWTFNQAMDINDAGWIVGYGSGPNGRRAVLLTPVPEPASLTLGTVGFLGLIMCARRRRSDGTLSRSLNASPATLRRFTSAILLSIFLGATASAAPLYHLTDLGTLGGSSYAAGINDKGQVVGYSHTGAIADFQYVYHAFLYSDSKMTDLGALPGGIGSQATDINNNGQVVGYSTSSGWAQTHAFLYSGGTMTDLGALGGSESFADSINDRGQIVGYVMGNAGRAFFYSGGTMTDLDAQLGGSGSYAYAINNSGQVAGASGNHAVLWTPTELNGASGTMTDLGTLGAEYLYSSSRAINDSGQVIGDNITEFGRSRRAFLYSGEFMHDLGTLGGDYSQAYDINDRGQVVGFAKNCTGLSCPGLGNSAFLYTGGTMVDLKTLVDSSAAGWSLGGNAVYVINNSGWIAGTGTTPLGFVHAYLLTTVVPESSTFALAAVGALVLVARQAWRKSTRSTRLFADRIL